MAKYEDCRRAPYYCSAGVLTVGIGSTTNVQSRDYADEEIADRWVNDLVRAEKCINNNFNGTIAPQFVFEAMTDVSFNVGCTGIGWGTDWQGQKQRTTLWKLAQNADWVGVCNRLTDFVVSGGKRLQGLVDRRKEFKAWCLSDPMLSEFK
jgi:lysozyme